MRVIRRSLLVLILLLPVAANAKSFVILTTGQPVGDAVAAAGGVLVDDYPAVGVAIADADSPDFLARIVRSKSVRTAVEDVTFQAFGDLVVQEAGLDPGAQGVNSEPFVGYQWNLWQIRAFDAAAAGFLGSGAKRARVAVLDSGIFPDQVDIRPNFNAQLSVSFVPGEGLVPVNVAEFNHGTHVAGTIAAAINNRGIQGVAPDAEIVAVKVLAEEGTGSFSWILRGIMYAAAIDADVINMSLGATFNRVNAGGGGMGLLVGALASVINYATASGVLVISAAGNEALDLNGNVWSIPAQSGNGMAVSATGPCLWEDFDRLAYYSNYGQSVVSVAAPGGSFECGYAYDGVIAPGNMAYYYFAQGTSMATPHVAGLAALIVGKYGEMLPAQLRTMIQNGAVDILKPGADPESGRGRIDCVNPLR